MSSARALVDGMSGARAARRRRVERDFPLARLTTVRTGGPAEFFARAGDRGGAARAARVGARGGQSPVSVVGSGSNLLIADDGVARARGQARPRARGDRAIDGSAIALRRRRAAARGRGARGPRRAVRHRVRREHPGHGRRRGADERERLRRRAGRACSSGWRSRGRGRSGAAARASSGSATAARTSATGEIVCGPDSRSLPADPATVTATLAEMRARRHEAQPQGIKTFGSTFKNPEDPRAEGRSAGLLLSEAGCNGLAVGGARFAPKHANFIENTGTATHRRRAGRDGRGAPARARALRRRARARGADARRRPLSLALRRP